MLRTTLADEIWPEVILRRNYLGSALPFPKFQKSMALELFVSISNREVEFRITETDVNASRELLDAAALAEDEAKHLALIQEHISPDSMVTLFRNGMTLVSSISAYLETQSQRSRIIV
ncbi:MAG: hypothetical protein R2688_02740 [Fimbriimonadaceae bacterium]